jgi:hypothetical protein
MMAGQERLLADRLTLEKASLVGLVVHHTGVRPDLSTLR